MITINFFAREWICWKVVFPPVLSLAVRQNERDFNTVENAQRSDKFNSSFVRVMLGLQLD
ncbi:MAG: hypothetical protein ACI9R3_004117 [Verrucomicrobiales bacterium]|jgi:hypothetical protein